MVFGGMRAVGQEGVATDEGDRGVYAVTVFGDDSFYLPSPFPRLAIVTAYCRTESQPLPEKGVIRVDTTTAPYNQEIPRSRYSFESSRSRAGFQARGLRQRPASAPGRSIAPIELPA